MHACIQLWLFCAANFKTSFCFVFTQHLIPHRKLDMNLTPPPPPPPHLTCLTLLSLFLLQFYHACDGDRIDKYVYCLTKYSVLATGDFLASTCSLWVTLIAMAQIPLDFSSAAQMAGPLALIVGVLLDRHSLWIIAVPTAVGLLLVAASWVGLMSLRLSLVRHARFRLFLCWAVVGDRVVSWCDDLDIYCHLFIRYALGFLFVVAVVLPNVLGCWLTY